MKYVLINPLSCNGEGMNNAQAYISTQPDAIKINITEISDYSEFFSKLSDEDEIVICGGDGTLNRFVNETCDIEYNNNIYFYPCGTGNDFYADVKEEDQEAPILINKYIKNLPVVDIDGKTYSFINNVGFGIDGYCCEVGDKLHAEGKPVNYTAVAIKGLLFHYRPTNAKVTVDGKEYDFKKVWLAPTMNGRLYGGGMMPTPDQKRLGEDKNISVMLFHDTSALKTLMIFPSLFKGEHIKYEKNVTVLTGKSISVEFSAPRSAQVDGETILGVKKYSARVDKIKTDNNAEQYQAAEI